MTTPASVYKRRLASGELQPDAAQERVVQVLERLHRELAARPGAWRRRLVRLAGGTIAPVRGAYLWGNVGRGKTLMMDLLFGCLPFDDKLRLHFHRFMGGVHEELRALRDQRDPLERVADRLADRTRVICFDEFAVTDIADAMILGGLLAALFERGVALIATSNLRPDRLYAGGLQRQRFLPAIALIEKHTEVVHVGGELDYRLRMLEQADVYQHPATAAAEQKLAGYFHAIGSGESNEHNAIEVLGRRIECRGASDGVIWFDFAAVCDGPRSQADYIELSRCYQTVLISNVPVFNGRMEDQARRFIALVDEFYDRRVKLILSAAAPPEQLYRGQKLTHEFRRTASRLQEMQSHEYLAAEHRP